MPAFKTLSTALLLIGVLLLAGCSSTQLVTSWRDDSYPQGQLKKPMVVAMAKKQIVRARLEDEFVGKLKAMGVDAAQSYKFAQGENLPDVNVIRATLAESDRDSVLLVRLIDVKEGTAYVPGMTSIQPLDSPNYNNFGSYYGSNYATYSTPGYTYEYTLYTLEMNLFEAKSEKLLWTAVTETEILSTVDAALVDLAETGAENLAKHKLFGK